MLEISTYVESKSQTVNSKKREQWFNTLSECYWLKLINEGMFASFFVLVISHSFEYRI